MQTSLYGASKAAAEGYIAAYAEAGVLSATVFRFVSVLGPRYSHGHVIDFVAAAAARPDRLHDPRRRKPAQELPARAATASPRCVGELDADDALRGVQPRASTGTAPSPTRPGWIAPRLGVEPEFEYTGGDRGWIGDNPFIYPRHRQVQARGWRPRFTIREAVESTVDYLLANPWILDATA